ncbi:MAG: SDR family oxidoreductase [Pseudomonadota bacterium]
MSLKLFDLSGKKALVTGSSQGIGFSLAQGLAAAGAAVVLNGRDVAKLEAAQRSLVGEGYAVSFQAFDVTDGVAAADGVAAIEAQGPIDILVNNAGIQRRHPLEEFPLDTFQEVLRANIESVFIVGQAVAKHMIPRGRGKIINIASLMSEAARYSVAPYTAAKGAVKQLTKGMCTDWARYGMQINAIGPGYFTTPLNRALFENQEFNAWLEKRTPAGRWGKTEELQGVCIFLASDASSFVNGQTIYVDGGVLATL